MKLSKLIFFSAIFVLNDLAYAQIKDPVVDAIVKEANENSQLEKLGHELLDVIGPRLVGSPQMLAGKRMGCCQIQGMEYQCKK